MRAVFFFRDIIRSVAVLFPLMAKDFCRRMFFIGKRTFFVDILLTLW